MKQLSLLKKPKAEYGGAWKPGTRKIRRPLDSKRPIHYTLKMKRCWGYPLSKKPVKRRVVLFEQALALKCRIKVHRSAHNGNHIHIVVSGRSRESFQRFLRGYAGVVARVISGAKKGKVKGKVWAHLAHSRVLNWGRDYFNSIRYVEVNQLEAFGIPRDFARLMIKATLDSRFYRGSPNTS